MAAEQDNLKKLLEIYRNRLKILIDFKALSLRISGEIEAKGEDAADAVDELTEKREALLEKIKEADMAARYCESLLGRNYKTVLSEVKSAVKAGKPAEFKPGWAAYLYKNFTEYKSVSGSIRENDAKNQAAVKALMEAMKSKLEAVKANKKMMDKFSDGLDRPSVGTLMNEKK